MHPLHVHAQARRCRSTAERPTQIINGGDCSRHGWVCCRSPLPPRGELRISRFAVDCGPRSGFSEQCPNRQYYAPICVSVLPSHMSLTRPRLAMHASLRRPCAQGCPMQVMFDLETQGLRGRGCFVFVLPKVVCSVQWPGRWKSFTQGWGLAALGLVPMDLSVAHTREGPRVLNGRAVRVRCGPTTGSPSVVPTVAVNAGGIARGPSSSSDSSGFGMDVSDP